MGVFFSILAGLLSASKDLASKRISLSISGVLSAFGSFLFALPYYLVLLGFLYLFGLEDFTYSSQFISFVFLRAISDMGAEWCKMEAIGRADVSFIAPFLGLAPLFLLFVSPVLTGDVISLSGMGAVLVVIFGTLVILTKKGSFSHVLEHKHALLFALGSSLCFTFNSCFDRLAVQEASPVLSGFAMTFLAALFLLPFAVRRGNLLSMRFEGAYKPLWLRGLFEVLFMISKLTALQYLPVQYVAALTRSSLVFTVVGAKVLYGEGEFKRRLLGSFLILIGVIGIILLG